MKKILLISVLCLVIIACGKKEEAQQEAIQATETTQGQSTEVPNPFIEAKNLEEASKIAGFTLSVPANYEDYKKQTISVGQSGSKSASRWHRSQGHGYGYRHRRVGRGHGLRRSRERSAYPEGDRAFGRRPWPRPTRRWGNP